MRAGLDKHLPGKFSHCSSLSKQSDKQSDFIGKLQMKKVEKESREKGRLRVYIGVKNDD